MKRSGCAVAVAAAMLMTACSSGQSLVDASSFEVQAGSVIELQYVNYAWVPTYKGFTIDASGNLFSWDRSGEQWKPADEDHPTADELSSKYSNKTAIRTMGSGDVQKYFALATDASKGTVTSPMNRCADAGEWVISAYLPTDNGRFNRVLIRQEGDMVRQNKSSAAKDLAARVDNLELMQRSSCRN